MDISEDDKALIIGLASRAVPASTGMHRHFLQVIAEKARPASALERSWFRYWLEWRSAHDAQEQSAELVQEGDTEAAAAVDEFIAWATKFRASAPQRDSIDDDPIPGFNDPFWAKRPTVGNLNPAERNVITGQFDLVVALIAKRSYLVGGEVAVLAGCFKRLTAKPSRQLSPRQLAACERIRMSLPTRYSWWLHGSRSRYGKRR
jgi:hypothetical protein